MERFTGSLLKQLVSTMPFKKVMASSILWDRVRAPSCHSCRYSSSFPENSSRLKVRLPLPIRPVSSLTMPFKDAAVADSSLRTWPLAAS